ncbi:MAG: hypothetical protein RLW62_02470 [Gammaproteobacteria bacterium]
MLEHVFAPPGIRADPERCAEMVVHDAGGRRIARALAVTPRTRQPVGELESELVRLCAENATRKMERAIARNAAAH